MKQFAVIGLGSFGRNLAIDLAKKGSQVLAVDRDEMRVNQVRDDVTQAVVADATEAEVMDRLLSQDLNAVIIALGDRVEESIITTLHVKELGIRHIYAKASSEDHAKVLIRLGATDVIRPEKDMALHLADQLIHPNMLENLPLDEHHSIVEIVTPPSFVGKTMGELKLRNQYHVLVLAVKEFMPEKLHIIPSADTVIHDNSALILLGSKEALDRIQAAQ